MGLRVKVADKADEFEQIARLNYETFVEEIPQYAANPQRTLVDRFHGSNTYLICLREGQLVGMVALRDKRPFSLDSKLQDLEGYLPAGERLCEIRLLSIRREKRHGLVFSLLMQAAFRLGLERNYDLGLISGRLKFLPLYEKLGFRTFGPQVGTPEAPYQPMYISPDTLNRRLSHIALLKAHGVDGAVQ